MSAGAWRLLGAGLALIVLLGSGAVFGVWLAAGHYRPLLVTANQDLAKTQAGRDNLEALASEQGRELGRLVRAGRDRAALAEKAVAQAKEEAKLDYAAANRIQQERIGGDQCAAANAVIDRELGL